MIPPIKHAESYRTGYMELGVWNFQRDCYLSDVNNGEIEMDSPRHVFLVEKSEISVFSEGGHRANVMASQCKNLEYIIIMQLK